MTYDPKADVSSEQADVVAVSKNIAMRAGSWFDRNDLTLEQRERAVASIIETALRGYHAKGVKAEAAARDAKV